ncbi:MAG: hypothetical protein U5R49_27650 [Deltaproteobacteria bacterium]|nr:hypothetical protein [Deltaproteobacteria bacterium]
MKQALDRLQPIPGRMLWPIIRESAGGRGLCAAFIVGSFDTGAMGRISAIGDVVNMAGRMEGANKVYGTQLLVSQAARESSFRD